MDFLSSKISVILEPYAEYLLRNISKNMSFNSKYTVAFI